MTLVFWKDSWSHRPWRFTITLVFRDNESGRHPVAGGTSWHEVRSVVRLLPLR